MRGLEVILCMVNIICQIVYEGTNTKQHRGYYYVCTIYSNPQYIHIIGLHYKSSYFYWLENNVHLRDFQQSEIHSCTSYLGNFESNIWTFYLFATIKVNKFKNTYIPPSKKMFFHLSRWFFIWPILILKNNTVSIEATWVGHVQDMYAERLKQKQPSQVLISSIPHCFYMWWCVLWTKI